jgi:hypothetical protein
MEWKRRWVKLNLSQLGRGKVRIGGGDSTDSGNSNSLKLNDFISLLRGRSKGVEEEMGKAEPESTGKRYGTNWRRRKH